MLHNTFVANEVGSAGKQWIMREWSGSVYTWCIETYFVRFVFSLSNFDLPLTPSERWLRAHIFAAACSMKAQKRQYIWVNYNISLTYIIHISSIDSPLLTIINHGFPHCNISSKQSSDLLLYSAVPGLWTNSSHQTINTRLTARKQAMSTTQVIPDIYIYILFTYIYIYYIILYYIILYYIILFISYILCE